jgi:hypothetical protein
MPRGRARTRIERGRTRTLSTLFGKVLVGRMAYRGAGVGDLHVAHAALNLPEGMASHGLAKLAAIEAARGSFADACERINAVTAAGVGHRQVQELAIGAAADIDSFYDRLVPAPATDATVLVMSVDGKWCRYGSRHHFDVCAGGDACVPGLVLGFGQGSTTPHGLPRALRQSPCSCLLADAITVT